MKSNHDLYEPFASLVDRLVIYIWCDLNASEVLAVAIICIACVWCIFGLDHVARVSIFVYGGVVIAANLTVMFVRVIA